MMNKIILLISVMLLSPLTKATEIHQHVLREIPDTAPVPQIQLEVGRDEKDGVNIALTLQNYLLNSPLCQQCGVSDDVILSGHAHLFINGEKKQRVYGSNFHVPAAWLRKGVNQIAVSLNSHAHENWTYQGHNLVASVFVDLSKAELVLHNFSSSPINHNHH